MIADDSSEVKQKNSSGKQTKKVKRGDSKITKNDDETLTKS